MELGKQVSLSCSIHRLSEHLDSLANQIAAVEETLCETLTENESKKIDVEKIQGLDYVRQSLEDCALLSLIISKSSASNGFIAEEIVSRLRLEELCPKVGDGLKRAAYHGGVERRRHSQRERICHHDQIYCCTVRTAIGIFT